MAPPQWVILNEMQSKARSFEDLKLYSGSGTRQLVRDYPIKPFALSAEEEYQDKGFPAALCFPGDALHPIYPGLDDSKRHRLYFKGKFGSKTEYLYVSNISNGGERKLMRKNEMFDKVGLSKL